MRRSTLVIRGLTHYWRTNLGVLCGVAVSTAVVVGALLVGDSVRYSLRRIALVRLGRTEAALVAPERLFAVELAGRIQDESGGKARIAPVLLLRGIAVTDGGNTRVSNVQVAGVDQRFWGLAPSPDAADAAAVVQTSSSDPSDVAVNAKLASQLGLSRGDEFLLRIEKPSIMPAETPLAAAGAASVARRLTVTRILSDEAFGRFSLQTDHVSPHSVFLPLEWLGPQVEAAGKANVLLAAGTPDSPVETPELTRAAAAAWRLSDVGLAVQDLEAGRGAELRSDRVFLDDQVSNTAMGCGVDATPILTYFVNAIEGETGVTPYSFVSAPGEPLVPTDMPDDEIILNDWLASDLQAVPGQEVALRYFVVGPMRQLEERSRTFRVRAVVPMEGAAADPTLMPRVPGLADAESCGDWEPGIPIRLKDIRKQDEAYWRDRRGTPKAFVSLSAAQGMWRNRFGSLTAVRFGARAPEAAELARRIRDRLRPEAFGLLFHDVRAQALQAATEAVDFGQLFIGLSFFIVAAALLLTGLLFSFGVESRTQQTGLLLAVGYTPRQVRRLFLAESALIAVVGATVGTVLGAAYNHAVLAALATVWRGAVGTPLLYASWRATSLTGGWLAGVVMALGTIRLTLARQTGRAVAELQTQSAGLSPDTGWRAPKRSLLFALCCALATVIILASVSPGKGRAAAGAFFGAGSLLLLCGIALTHALLLAVGGKQQQRLTSVGDLARRNCARRRLRSLATVAVLACGVFLVVTVAANRHDPLQHAHRNSSGTGGYELYAEAALPVVRDLNTPDGRREWGLDEAPLNKLQFLGLRMRRGDDASCLNLNRVSDPRILGVDPTTLARRESFTFMKTHASTGGGNPWTALNTDPGDGTIPAIADQNVIVWSLGKRVGKTLTVVDEKGRNVELRFIAGLTNSVFQGSVIIGDAAFRRLYPSVGGHQVFLVEAPASDGPETAELLAERFEDVGLEVSSTASRLAEFATVENTYLTIFLALGGLGLILGSVGIGVVVLRNVLDRRAELALLRAVGFTRVRLQFLLFAEHALLLLAGTVCGGAAALVAVLPALLAPGAGIPYTSVAAVLACVVLSGLVWAVLAVAAAARGELLPALRSE